MASETILGAGIGYPVRRGTGYPNFIINCLKGDIMEVQYKIGDGFIRNGYHTVEVDDEEIEDCETIDDALEVVDQAIEDDFRNKVLPYINDEDSVKEKIREILYSK